MISKVKQILFQHIQRNFNKYIFLFLSFIIGLFVGAFTINGMDLIQIDELTNYFKGFLELFSNQKIDSNELLKIAILQNAKLILLLWILGVSIIGIPFIFLVIGIRGFITGFSSGLIIKIFGLKGIIFILLTLIPKEIIIVPCIIAIGV